MADSLTKKKIRGARRSVLLLTGTVLFGTFGLMAIERWSFFDALYMSVITITTVGFQEVHPLSFAGRMFILLYIVGGLGIALYCIGKFGEVLVQTSLVNWVEKKRMGSGLKSMSQHFIVCGYGRMGIDIVKRLVAKNVPVVVIEKDEAKIAELAAIAAAGGTLSWLTGDATEDKLLLAAGVQRARGLATVLGDDVDNLYVVLSTRLLNHDLQIVARSSSETNIDKLYKAGANSIVSPYKAGATKVAQLLINPQVAEIFESVSEGEKMELAEIRVNEGSPYLGKYLAETDFSTKGVIIVAIRDERGQLSVPPEPRRRINFGDALVAFGKTEALDLVLNRV